MAKKQERKGSNTERKGRRFPIQIKMLSALLVLGMLSSALMISTLLRFVKADKVTYIQDLNSDIAHNTAESVRLAVIHVEEQMKLLVTSMGMSDLTSEQGQKVLETIFNGYNDFLFATVRANDRIIAQAARTELLQIADSEIDSYIRSRETSVPFQEVYRGKVFVKNISQRDKQPTFIVSVPFLMIDSTTPIVVTAEVRLNNLLRIVGRSAEFETILVDRDGVVLAHSDSTKVMDRADLSNLEIVKALLSSSTDLPIAGTLEYTGPDNQQYLGSYAPVGIADLGVVIQKPEEVAYLAAKRLSRQLINVTLLIALAAAVMSFLMSRMLSRPIRTLSGATARIAEGDFDVKIPIRSSDEIGELADRFEKMAHALKERERELKETYEQLVQSEKLAAFGQIGAGITHEIKNPLTGIMGFAQFSLRKLTDPKVLEKNLKIIEKEAKRCKEILDNLLKFTRKEKTAVEVMEIDQVVEDTIELLDHQLGTKSIEIERALGAEDACIEGNANQLQQVFMNMIINAEHAMKDGGKFTVSSKANDNGSVTISFKDTGCGIKKENLKKLFEPFFTTKEKGVGTGLGLSVSYSIIEQHHGRITVESEEGVGTTFHITLPMTDLPLNAAAGTASASKEMTLH
ncbi:ATP-binding protein [Acidobacteriota bacterium]